MRQPFWRGARHAQRATSDVAMDHSRLLFVGCAESAATASLAAAFPTALVLQTLAGPPRELDAATRAAVEHAVLGQGVRHIAVVGHDGCRWCGDEPRSGTHAWSVERCHGILADAELRGVLRQAAITIHALWVDEQTEGVFACPLDGSAPKRLDEAELAAMFRTLAGMPA